MKIKSAEFLISAVSPLQYPEVFLPEIALAGRSNVGKSSLINMLLQRKNLARTSQTPGKTQTINFYEINKRFRFADLPGYGYAKVSKKDKDKWKMMIHDYLSTREMLLEIFLLQDVRREPREEDLQMMEYMKSLGYKGKIILTKADKLSRNQQMRSVEIYKSRMKLEKEDIFLTSSSKRTGREELLQYLDCIVTQAGELE